MMYTLYDGFILPQGQSAAVPPGGQNMYIIIINSTNALLFNYNWMSGLVFYAVFISLPHAGMQHVECMDILHGYMNM